MWGKRMAFVVGIMAMVLVIAAGCGRPAAKKKNPAEERAVAFYRAYWFERDYEAAWDMSLPGTFSEYTSKEDFLARKKELDRRFDTKPVPERAIQVEEHQRVDDYVYLISESRNQTLIWVTNTPQGWMVRKYQSDGGGPIPWSSVFSQRYS